MVYVAPNQDGSKVAFRSRYQNFIGGEWVEPAKGKVTVHGPVPLGRGEAVSALASARVRKAEERARVVRGGRIGRLR